METDTTKFEMEEMGLCGCPGKVRGGLTLRSRLRHAPTQVQAPNVCHAAFFLPPTKAFLLIQNSSLRAKGCNKH
jgi:hypothetical protein